MVDENRIHAVRAADAPAAIDGPHVRPKRAGLRLVADAHGDDRIGASAGERVGS